MRDVRRPNVSSVQRDGDVIHLELTIPEELFWFRGHFPEFPILPGVIQLDWVLTFSREHFDTPSAMGQEFQVKFNQPILPSDALTLTIALERDRNRLRFSYSRRGETCSSGNVKVPT